MSNSQAILDRRIGEFTAHGAVPITGSFDVAGNGQANLSYQGRWLFLTPNDPNYQDYVGLLSGANLKHLVGSAELTSDEVVVSVIPNDARNLPQFMRSRQPDIGPNSRDVFFMVGRALAQIAQQRTEGRLPVHSELHKILFLRHTMDVMFTPTADATQSKNKDEIVDSIKSQLLSDFAKFGGSTLLQSFEEGVQL